MPRYQVILQIFRMLTLHSLGAQVKQIENV